MKGRTRDGRSKTKDHDEARVGTSVHNARVLIMFAILRGWRVGSERESQSYNVVRHEKGS